MRTCQKARSFKFGWQAPPLRNVGNAPPLRWNRQYEMFRKEILISVLANQPIEYFGHSEGASGDRPNAVRSSRRRKWARQNDFLPERLISGTIP